MFRKILTNREGTALLVAMWVMGVLIAVSLVLSSLVLREIRVTAGVLDGGRAYYAAESGVEVALYNLNNELPGWETEGKKYVPIQLDDDYRVVGEYRVDNTCTAYPCFDGDFDQKSAETDLSSFYDVLDLNQSITIPLFVVKNINGVKTNVPVDHFSVEFYANFNPRTDFKINDPKALNFLSSWDVLRWKIYGINKILKRTDSISDFTALSMVDLGGDDEEFPTNRELPAWFGTISCSEIPDGDRYTSKISCGKYAELYGSDDIEIVKTKGQEANVYAGTCGPTKAREFYEYAGTDKLQAIVPCKPIESFLKAHEFSYLTLTNLMNPAVFKNASQPGGFTELERLSKSKIFYRIELYAAPSAGELAGNEIVREFADITANGYSGKSKQSISVKMQRGSFMPVFNFSLYSTYKSGK